MPKPKHSKIKFLFMVFFAVTITSYWNSGLTTYSFATNKKLDLTRPFTVLLPSTNQVSTTKCPEITTSHNILPSSMSSTPSKISTTSEISTTSKISTTFEISTSSTSSQDFSETMATSSLPEYYIITMLSLFNGKPPSELPKGF